MKTEKKNTYPEQYYAVLKNRHLNLNALLKAHFTQNPTNSKMK